MCHATERFHKGAVAVCKGGVVRALSPNCNPTGPHNLTNLNSKTSAAVRKMV